MDRKIEALAQWGCDTQGALDRVLDDEAFYLECLDMVPEDRNFQGLAQALRDGDAPAGFDCAHALKGILANLGLTPMYRKAVELVEPLRAGHCENLQGKLEELEEMRRRLSEILK